MQAAYFPDWDKIGRKIGKRIRDVLRPPSHSDTSKEERLNQRLSDVLKSFAYFDTFDEILDWHQEDVDPLQRANVSIIKRPYSAICHVAADSCPLLLCHDYSGGYHEYEAARSTIVDHEKYFCHYLNYVETFVYFSHKLVCCPPPTWTNSLHRNGVKALATFCVEPGTLNVEQMLHIKDGVYTMATKMAEMAESLGFDGWLLNIEKAFSLATRDPIPRLLDFVTQLRSILGDDKMLIWYDSLTDENEVEYQNTLSASNVSFAIAAGSLFTNYKWTESKLREGKIAAQWHGLDQRQLYFGIDMWAQNTNMSGPKRVTYPRQGGGGTLTGTAVRKLADNEVSGAIFGPAWAYEHFSPSQASEVDRSVWEGTPLPNDLSCDCKKGRPHHQPGYEHHPIKAGATNATIGSQYFFQTDFRCPFEMVKDEPHSLKSRIGLVWPQPCPKGETESSWVDLCDAMQSWRFNFTHVHGERPVGTDLARFCYGSYLQCRIVNSAQNTDARLATNESQIWPLRAQLYNLDMPADGTLTATVICSNISASTAASGFFFAYRLASESDVFYQDVYLPNEGTILQESIVITVPKGCATSPGIRLIGFGAVCNAAGQDVECISCPELDLFHVSIAQRLAEDARGSIFGIHMIERSSGEHCEKRIAWQWSLSREAWPPNRPWSHITGPFERFAVEVDGKMLGEIGATEFPLQDAECGNREDLVVHITGSMFGGDLAEAWESIPVPRPNSS